VIVRASGDMDMGTVAAGRGEVNRRDESIFRVNKLRMLGRFAECDWGQAEMRFEVIFERYLTGLIEKENFWNKNVSNESSSLF
jgi:hypothetical protein